MILGPLTVLALVAVQSLALGAPLPPGRAMPAAPSRSAAPASSHLCVPSAELPPSGHWEVGLRAFSGPLVAWERSIVAGQYLPNPGDIEYAAVVPAYDRGLYPVAAGALATPTSIPGHYSMWYPRQPQTYGHEEGPHHDGPSYYLGVPRLLALSPYVLWTANPSLQLSVHWSSFVSTQREDHRASGDGVLQFPTFGFRWQMVRQGRFWPSLASGFQLVTDPRIDVHTDPTRYERFLHLAATWRAGPAAVTAGWTNVNFLPIGGVFLGLHVRLHPAVAIAVDWSWATWIQLKDMERQTRTPNYMVASASLQLRTGGWLLEAGWANTIGEQRRRRDRYPAVKIAREFMWRSIFRVLYYDSPEDGARLLSRRTLG